MKIELKILNKEFYKDPNVIKKSGWDKKTEYYPIPNLPAYATSGSAAMDLVCTKDVVIYPGERLMIPTGLAIWICSDPISAPYGRGFRDDIGYAGFILPRSGLGTKGLILANTIGLIDEDYQGELIISAWNSNEGVEPGDYYNDGTPGYYTGTKYETDDRRVIKLKAGNRFAQIYFAPVIKAEWKIVEEFSDVTKRATGGFGSSGK